ncbi:MAG: 50S ribosomal protein L37ae [Nanoarchaeota archaeon]|nr:50S ribosomal protein L37ae [Nanoarchaeota archaeon]
MVKTKKVGASGRFGARYGKKVRARVTIVENKQRQHQRSPFNPKGKAKRIASGIWKDKKSGRIFAGNTYYLEN